MSSHLLASLFLFSFYELPVCGLEIHILATGNIAGDIFPYDAESGLPCYPDLSDTTPTFSPNCLGGSVRAQNVINARRTENSIVADVGNFYFGSPFPLEAHVDLFNQINYDVAGVSVSYLQNKRAFETFAGQMTSNTTFIGTNFDTLYNFSSSSLMSSFWLHSNNTVLFISTVLGVKGYPDPTGLATVPPRIGVADDFDHIRERIEVIKRSSPVHTVILLSTLSQEDHEFIAAQIHEIDLIISTSDTPRRQGKCFDSNMTFFTRTRRDGDLVGVAFIPSSQHILEVTLTMDDTNNEIIDILWNPIELDGVGDGSIDWAGPKTSLTQLNIDLNTFVTRSPLSYAGSGQFQGGNCAVCSLVANSLLQRCGDCDFAFIDEAALNANVLAGDLTKRDLLNVFPFGDRIITVNISAWDLYIMMTTMFEELDDEACSFPQVAGMRWAYNDNRYLTYPEPTAAQKLAGALQPYDSRLVIMEFLNSNGGVENFPIDLDKQFKIVTTSMIASGGYRYNLPNLGEFFEPHGSVYAALTELEGLSFDGLRTQSELEVCDQLTIPFEIDSPCTSLKTFVVRYDFLHPCPSNISFCMSHFVDVDEPQPFIKGKYLNASMQATMYLNKYQCATCSGWGECSYGVCTCPNVIFPNEPAVRDDGGESGGYIMFNTSDCGHLKSIWTEPIWQCRVAVNTFFILCLLWSLGFIYILHKNKDTKPVKATSVLFGYVIGAGCLAGCGAMIMCVLEQNTFVCTAFIWLILIAYSLVFGAITIKTHRVVKIFNDKTKIQKVDSGVSNQELSIAVALYTSGNLAILLVWLFSGSPITWYPDLPVADHFSLLIFCSYGDYAYVFVGVMAVYNFSALFYAVSLARQLRNIQVQIFDESRQLGAAIYNILFTFCFFPILAVIDTQSPNLNYGLRAILVGYQVISAPLIMYFRTFSMVYSRKPEMEEVNKGAGKDAPRERSPSVIQEIAEIKNQISEVHATLVKLRSTFADLKKNEKDATTVYNWSPEVMQIYQDNDAAYQKDIADLTSQLKNFN